jgi:hypothetical protein
MPPTRIEEAIARDRQSPPTTLGQLIESSAQLLHALTGPQQTEGLRGQHEEPHTQIHPQAELFSEQVLDTVRQRAVIVAKALEVTEKPYPGAVIFANAYETPQHINTGKTDHQEK